MYKHNIFFKKYFELFYAFLTLLKGSVGLRLRAYFLEWTVCLTPSSASPELCVGLFWGCPSRCMCSPGQARPASTVHYYLLISIGQNSRGPSLTLKGPKREESKMGLVKTWQCLCHTSSWLSGWKLFSIVLWRSDSDCLWKRFLITF